MGTAPKNSPQSSPSATTMKTVRSPGKGSSGVVTVMSVSITQPAWPSMVSGSLRRSLRVGSYGLYMFPVIAH